MESMGPVYLIYSKSEILACVEHVLLLLLRKSQQVSVITLNINMHLKKLVKNSNKNMKVKNVYEIGTRVYIKILYMVNMYEECNMNL